MRLLVAAIISWLTLSLCLVQAQQIMGFGGDIGSGTGRFTPLATPVAQDNTTNPTFSGVAIGNAAANRVVIVGISDSGAVPTKVTIGGVSAALQARVGVTDATIDLWTATVTSGATADIAISSGLGSVMIQTAAFYGGTSTAFATATNFLTPTSNVITSSIGMPGGAGFAVAFGMTANGNPNAGFCQWTGTQTFLSDLTSTDAGGNLVSLSMSHAVVNIPALPISCAVFASRLQLILASFQ